MKQIKVKSLTEKQQLNNQIDYLRKNNIVHSLYTSNYTTKIESAGAIYNFADRLMNAKAFIGYQMIKKDIREFTANGEPQINKYDLEYFSTDIVGSIFKRQAYLVDIKSAYATILLNDGFITEKTFNYINSLPKKDRLAAVGMLASQKNKFNFVGKELISIERIQNPLQNYFWYCVKRTSELMNEIREENKTLFFWVDGIYFQTLKESRAAQEFLKREKYKFSEKKLFHFHAETKTNQYGDEYNKISFFEADKNINFEDAKKSELDFKVFTVPKNKQIKKDLEKWIFKQQNLNH